MMMGVYKTGDDDMTSVTQYFVRLNTLRQFIEIPNLDDPSIALKECAVLNEVNLVIICDTAEKILATD
jgi:hypothetical protein